MNLKKYFKLKKLSLIDLRYYVFEGNSTWVAIFYFQNIKISYAYIKFLLV